MSDTFYFDITTMLVLLPLMAALLRGTGPLSSTGGFRACLALAVCGTVFGVTGRITGTWSTGLADALMATVAACTLIYALICMIAPGTQRLGVLLLPYLAMLIVAALTVDAGQGKPLAANTPELWAVVHIAGAVTAYALVTVAAIAAAAALVQDRALRRKKPNALSRHLPSVADSEFLQRQLLALALTVLVASLISGTAILYMQKGFWLRIDHKTLLSLASLGLISLLLVLQVRTGLRGRSAGRLVLAAWLLLSLAYPGVKFVREVLLGG